MMSGISRPTSVPITNTKPSSTSWNWLTVPNAMNSTGADNPPTSATASSTSRKRTARSFSIRRESHAPTPIADRYRPITSENCVTESPNR
jgi:hypothetical protein